MDTIRLKRMLAVELCLGLGISLGAAAQTGYMAFLQNGPTGTTVTTGEAASYMRAGKDCLQSPCDLLGDVALPNRLQFSKVTTWRDNSSLHFRLEIPDITTVNTHLAPGAINNNLVCGDQIIVQIGPARTADAQLVVGKEFRFEVVIKNNLISDTFRRLPNAVTHNWKGTAEATFDATAALMMGMGTWGNEYIVTLDIPLTSIGSPAGDIGLAMAIINDLGNSSTDFSVNQATGTAFPLGMGLTPESDPNLQCAGAASPSGVTATGNWVNPSTWGIGFWTLSSAMDVTFSQSPYPALSDAIRIGKCTAQWASIPAVPSLTNWDAFQHTANNWYVFNMDKPCRMAIWFTPQVSGPAGTVVNRRFFVVFGRPNIAPQEWYVAGVTGEVPVSGSSTPVSFIWDKPTAIPFTDHPCFKIYALQSGTTSADSTILLGITTQVRLDSVETANNASLSNSRAAQMNFANINSGTCSDALCQPLSLRDATDDGDKQPRVVIESAPFSRTEGVAFLQDSARRRGRPPLAKDSTPTRDSVGKSVRIIAYGYGVANPSGNKPYVYVEPIGALGWAVPAASYANRAVTLNADFNNPRVVETAFVGGRRIDVPAPARRLLVALKIDVPVGTPSPRIDLAAVNASADRLVPPGDMNATRIVIRPTHRALPLWIWLLVALVVVIVLVVRFLRSRPAP